MKYLIILLKENVLRLQSNLLNAVEAQVLLDEIKALTEKLEHYSTRTVYWCEDDFEMQAKELEKRKGRILYDRTTFTNALETMITKHDANLGINWDMITEYLNSYCRITN
jgi:hypothetical protein